jgi:hypothetical protein
MEQARRSPAEVPTTSPRRAAALRLAGGAIGVALCTSVMVCSSVAAAQEPTVPVRSTGHYLEDANAARRLRPADDLTATARAILAAYIADPQARSLDMVLRAEHAARKALVLDPSNIETQLQLAIAIGLKARRVSLAEVIAQDYMGQGRSLFEGVLALTPENAWAHAVKGAWNLEIVRRAPDLAARMIGASLKSGMDAYERALALAPADPAIAYQYGLALLALNAPQYRARARAVLKAAVTSTAGSAFDAAMREHAARLLAAMDAQDDQAVRRLVAQGLS